MEDFRELIPEKIHGKPTGRLIPGGPASRVTIKEGETKIFTLKKFNLGPPPEVIVSTPTPEKAFCFQVVRLKDPTKKAYIDATMSDMNNQMVPVEAANSYYFQVCGKAVGTVELSANRRGNAAPYVPYANPVTITVAANPKRLQLSSPFATLWGNHPLHASISYPCDGHAKAKQPAGHNPPLHKMQCMVRLCYALAKSNVDLAGMRGFTSCWHALGKPPPGHEHHFSHPYEFERWGPARQQSYDWVASTNVPEPMPGLAAFWFVMNRTGVILFDHYFDVAGREPMFGGHIDLWNKNTMGNTLYSSAQLSAFLRARRISFWPIA